MNKLLIVCSVVAILIVLCIANYEEEKKSTSLSNLSYIEDLGEIEEEGIIILDELRVEGNYGYIKVLHDNKRNVTCWRLGNGLSCIPDYMLEEKNNANT